MYIYQYPIIIIWILTSDAKIVVLLYFVNNGWSVVLEYINILHIKLNTPLYHVIDKKMKQWTTHFDSIYENMQINLTDECVRGRFRSIAFQFKFW